MKRIETSLDLRDMLSDTIAELRSGELDRATAETVANLAGKMVATAKTQVAYAIARQERPGIKFLDGDATTEAPS